MKGKHCANVVKASENVLLHQILSQKGSNPNEIKRTQLVSSALVHLTRWNTDTCLPSNVFSATGALDTSSSQINKKKGYPT